MTKLLLILFVGLCFETMGVVSLNKGLKRLEGPKNYSARELARLVGRAATNRQIVMGVAFEAVFFVCLLMMMATLDPLTTRNSVIAWRLTVRGSSRPGFAYRSRRR